MRTSIDSWAGNLGDGATSRTLLFRHLSTSQADRRLGQIGTRAPIGTGHRRADWHRGRIGNGAGSATGTRYALTPDSSRRLSGDLVPGGLHTAFLANQNLPAWSQQRSSCWPEAGWLPKKPE